MTDRTELRRLLDEATPGPWHAWNRGIGFEIHTEAEHNPIRCDPLNSEFRETFRGPDAQLIVAAVNTLPARLDALDAAEADLNDAILYWKDTRDALARQTPHYLAAKDALERVRELHWPTTVEVLDTECAAEECDHEDACPLVDYAVCAECHDIGDEAHPYAYEEGGVDRVAWPCPTRRALDATPTGGES